MNTSRKPLIGALVFALVAIPGSLVVRSYYAKKAAAARLALKEYQERQATVAQVEATAQANEQRLAELQRAVQERPKEVSRHWALADHLQKLNRLDEALLQLQEITQLDPKSEEAAVGIANIYLAGKKLDEAKAAYKAVTVKFPKSVDGWQGLAAVLYHQRRFREAGDVGRTALRLKPDDLGTRYIVASSALEFALEFPDEHATQDPLAIARGIFSEMLKTDPDSAMLHYKLGLATLLMHEKKEALVHLEKAAKLQPELVAISVDYAQTLISAGKHDEAYKFIQERMADNKEVPALYHLLSKSLQFKKDPASVKIAVEASKKATELAPNTTMFWEHLGFNYLRAQDFENARKAYEKALLLDPNQAGPYKQLAAIFTRLGDSKRATAAATMATKMVSNDETLKHIEALSAQYPGAVNLMLIRADRYRTLKMLGAARDLYEQILKIDPANAEAKAGLTALEKLTPPGSGTP